MELGNYENLLKTRAGKPKVKGVHSLIHEVTLEVIKWVEEPDKFGMWLGAVKRIGAGEMRELLKRVKEKGIKNGRYLLACTRTDKRI